MLQGNKRKEKRKGKLGPTTVTTCQLQLKHLLFRELQLHSTAPDPERRFVEGIKVLMANCIQIAHRRLDGRFREQVFFFPPLSRSRV